MLLHSWRRFAAIVASASVAFSLLTVSPVAAAFCNPPGSGTDVPLKFEFYDNTPDTDTDWTRITANITLPSKFNVTYGSPSLFYVQLQETGTGAYARAGIKVVKNSDNTTHYYRYYRMQDLSGDIRISEANEEVSRDQIDGSYFEIERVTQLTGIEWWFRSADDPTEDMVWMGGYIGNFDPSRAMLRAETNNTNSQWFGSAGEALVFRDARYKNNHSQVGDFNMQGLWDDGPYGMTYPKWSETGNNTLYLWDTRC